MVSKFNTDNEFKLLSPKIPLGMKIILWFLAMVAIGSIIFFGFILVVDFLNYFSPHLNIFGGNDELKTDAEKIELTSIFTFILILDVVLLFVIYKIYKGSRLALNIFIGYALLSLFSNLREGKFILVTLFVILLAYLFSVKGHPFYNQINKDLKPAKPEKFEKGDDPKKEQNGFETRLEELNSGTASEDRTNAINAFLVLISLFVIASMVYFLYVTQL